MSNTTPDFSRDPECVDLAKAMRDAQRACDPLLSHWDGMEPYYQKMLLACADAAITLLGSGYHLPEATEANAERLAEAHWNSERGQIDINVTNEERLEYMLDALHALHAAFGDPAEKPAPVFAAPVPETQCTATNGDHRCDLPAGHGGEHSAERLDWEEPSGNGSECRICQHHGPDANCACQHKPAKDPVCCELNATWAEESDKRELRLRFMIALAGNAHVAAALMDRPSGFTSKAEWIADFAGHLAEVACKK